MRQYLPTAVYIDVYIMRYERGYSYSAIFVVKRLKQSKFPVLFLSYICMRA